MSETTYVVYATTENAPVMLGSSDNRDDAEKFRDKKVKAMWNDEYGTDEWTGVTLDPVSKV